MQAGSQTKTLADRARGGGEAVLLLSKKSIASWPADGLRGYLIIDSRVMRFSNAYLDGLTSKLAPRGEGVRPRPLRHSVMCKADLWVDKPTRSQEQASPPCLHAAPHTRACHDCTTQQRSPNARPRSETRSSIACKRASTTTAHEL